VLVFVSKETTAVLSRFGKVGRRSGGFSCGSMIVFAICGKETVIDLSFGTGLCIASGYAMLRK